MDPTERPKKSAADIDLERMIHFVNLGKKVMRSEKVSSRRYRHLVVEQRRRFRAFDKSVQELMEIQKKSKRKEKRIQELNEASKFLESVTPFIDHSQDPEENEKLMRDHAFFADKVFDYLLDFYGMPYPDEVEIEDNKDIYEVCVGEAILGLCIVYRDQWREMFRKLRDRLINLEHFVFYCCAVTLDKDIRYFYSFLIRVAIIFEMALFCFEEGYEYFHAAAICLPLHIDYVFFRDAGGFEKLKCCCSLIANATRPLRRLVSWPKDEFRSLAHVVKDIEGFVHRGSIRMTDEERSLLKVLSNQSETGSDDSESLNMSLEEKLAISDRKEISPEDDQSINDESETYLENEKEMLIEYLKSVLPSICENITDWDTDKDYFVNLVLWDPQTPKTEEMAAEVEEKEDDESEIDELEEDFETLELKSTESTDTNEPSHCKQLSGHGSSVSLEDQAISAPVPPEETGAIPKKRKAINRKYIPFQTKYTKKVIKMYRDVLSSFIKQYLHGYFAPLHGQECAHNPELDEDHIFIMKHSYLQERVRYLFFPDAFKRMKGWQMPSRKEVLVPIRVQQVLDEYIKDLNYRAYDIGEGYVAAGPDVPESQVHLYTPWIISGAPEEKKITSGEGIRVLNRFKKLLKHTRDVTKSTTAEDSFYIDILRKSVVTNRTLPPSLTLGMATEDPFADRTLDASVESFPLPRIFRPKKKKQKKKKSKKLCG